MHDRRVRVVVLDTLHARNVVSNSQLIPQILYKSCLIRVCLQCISLAAYLLVSELIAAPPLLCFV